MMRKDACALAVGCVGVILVSNALLTACAPPPAATAVPTQSGYPGPATQAIGYPGPGATPAATLPRWSSDYDPAVTPPPDESIQTGPVALAANPQDNLPFKWREEVARVANHTIVQIFVQYKGQEVQLGNDNGAAQVWSASAQYLAWSFEHMGSPRSGLFVRVVATGKDILIASGDSVGQAKVDGDWVLYINWSGPTKAPGVTQYDAPRETTRLIGYNLVTGQSVTVSTGIPGVPGRSEMSFFGLSGNRAGWIEYDLQKQTYAMKLEELGSGAVQILNVPLHKPLFFSLSNNLVVWRDTYWHGYSLDQDALFTIPYVPKEWETKPVQIVARDSAVEWVIRVNDTDHLYYTAPVVSK